MFYYIVLLFIVLLLEFFDSKVKNNKDLFFKICILIIILFSGLRYYIGWDYKAYYDTIAFGIDTNIYSKREWLNYSLINITRNLFWPEFYFMFTSFVSIFLIGKTIKKYSVDKWMSIYLYLTFPLFFLNSLSVIRNFMAIAITVYSTRYIIDRKLFRFIIAIIIAAGFHQSAYIAILLYPIANIKLNKKLYFLFLAIIPLMKNTILAGMNKILPYYYVYLTETTNKEGRFGVIVILLLLISILMIDKKMINDNIYNQFFNFYFMGCLIYAIFFKYGTLGHRLSLYGSIYMIFIIPFFMDNFKNRTKIFLKLILWVMYFLFYIYTILRGSATYLPYRIILPW